MRAIRRRWCVFLAAAVIAAMFAFPLAGVSADKPEAAGGEFCTATMTRGNLVATIRAIGTIEPEEVVEVGSQVTGVVESFGPDPHRRGKSIDFGSRVEEGALLAQIDDTMYAGASSRPVPVAWRRRRIGTCESQVGAGQGRMATCPGSDQEQVHFEFRPRRGTTHLRDGPGVSCRRRGGFSPEQGCSEAS